MTFFDSGMSNESSRAQVNGKGSGVLLTVENSHIAFQTENRVGDELHMENYSGVLQIENCCAVCTENDSGTL